MGARGGGVYAKMSFTCVTEGPPIYKLPYKPVHTPCLSTFEVQIATEKQTFYKKYKSETSSEVRTVVREPIKNVLAEFVR